MNRGSTSSIRVIMKIIERDKINFWPEYDADEERKQAALGPLSELPTCKSSRRYFSGDTHL